MADIVSGGDGRPHGTGGTFEGAGAVIRSADRERYELETAALRQQAEKTTTRAQQWVDELHREQEKKANERAEKIRTGRLIVHADGSYTEIL